MILNRSGYYIMALSKHVTCLDLRKIDFQLTPDFIKRKILAK